MKDDNQTLIISNEEELNEYAQLLFTDIKKSYE